MDKLASIEEEMRAQRVEDTARLDSALAKVEALKKEVY